MFVASKKILRSNLLCHTTIVLDLLQSIKDICYEFFKNISSLTVRSNKLCIPPTHGNFAGKAVGSSTRNLEMTNETNYFLLGEVILIFSLLPPLLPFIVNDSVFLNVSLIHGYTNCDKI